MRAELGGRAARRPARAPIGVSDEHLVLHSSRLRLRAVRADLVGEALDLTSLPELDPAIGPGHHDQRQQRHHPAALEVQTQVVLDEDQTMIVETATQAAAATTIIIRTIIVVTTVVTVITVVNYYPVEIQILPLQLVL